MNIDKKLEFINSTVYHELGHVLGYCLAEKSEKTSLGPIQYIELGFPNNFVTPKTSYYHEEGNILEELDRFKEATSNIPRTIAWFIEVILGCTLEALYESKEFKTCFSFGSNYNGHIDFSNLGLVRNVSSFNWNFDDIYELQEEVKILLIKTEILKKVETIVEGLLKRIGNSPGLQLRISDKEAIRLSEKVNSIISVDLQEGYDKIIKKHSAIFETDPDLVAVIKFQKDLNGNRIHRSHEKFGMDFFGNKIIAENKIKFIQKNNVRPGEEIHGEIKLSETSLLSGKLKLRQEFQIFKKSQNIGSGIIMSIKNNNLLE
ncbi:hypothetical protein SAMN06296241_3150 [Salinimicrobium sediminis]|uniref:Uncharacterized protein n=1 Tax=Salinimicrobium sediminis TaxID=1343891 RepID=A0A285X8C4_9FLAO|nr:hypothetical protein [Salinimicrobium sediminis]SOC81571.1 hypothetical protein SAMN06296241_3150 [Salinimicrobium sediminis]